MSEIRKKTRRFYLAGGLLLKVFWLESAFSYHRARDPNIKVLKHIVAVAKNTKHCG